MTNAKKLRAGLVGVTGYTGMELTRLLESHPFMRLTQVTSRQQAGKRLEEIYPFLQGMESGNLVITEPNVDTLHKECDVIFLAIPHGAAMNMGAALLEKGCKVVDLSADYRLRDAQVYEQWYKVQHTQPVALGQAVYGLPELYAAEIASASLIANPGCYPTASILALYPALYNDIIVTDDIVIDAKSGTTGAGRGANIGSLFCEVYDTFKAYNLTKHRHTPEIEQEASKIAEQDIVLSFNTHLLPINRGILATIYTKLIANAPSITTIHQMYTNLYSTHQFVRVLPLGTLPEIRNVRGTMFCDIAITQDARTNRLIIVSAIDNLCRGASGQAIANANLMLQLPVSAGLCLAPMVP